MERAIKALRRSVILAASPPSMRENAPAANDTVVYTGSDNHSNQAAVRWLLTDVWAGVLAERPHAVLRLVGLVCQPLQQTPLTSVPNVEWVGFVDRPADELEWRGRAAVPSCRSAAPRPAPSADRSAAPPRRRPAARLRW